MTDWIEKAAKEIVDDRDGDYRGSHAGNVSIIVDTLRKHLPRCDSCKHWKQFDPNDIAGYCHYQCNDPDAKMWAEAYDGIHTKPDFGCIEWRAK